METPQIKLNETGQDKELETPIGTKEKTSLKATNVKVASVRIESVGDKGNKKVVLTVKHPDKEEVIDISSVAYFNKSKQLKESGLWYNKDEEGNIQKGSALALFMEINNVSTLKELEGNDLPTCLDEKGYLCFKAYN